jgi:Flp pilus assembly protein TadD
VHDRSYLDSASVYLNASSDEVFDSFYHALVRLAFLKEDYSEVVRLEERKSALKLSKALPAVTPVEEAWTHYRIAESFQRTGRTEKALSHFHEAVRLEPFQSAFRNKYAAALESAGRIGEAEQQYLFLLRETPDDVSALVNYGYLLMSSRRDLVRADSLYRRALSLDPDHIQALLNKTGTSVLMGDIAGARTYLQRALRLDPHNLQAQTMLKALGP